MQTAIDFPATANLGVAVLVGTVTVSLEADWTQWSSFKSLDITFPNPALTPFDLDRQDNWKNSWAYRVGVEKKFGAFAVRAGYYKDKTPQPTADAGPLLADNDRNGYTLGFGYNTDHWGIDVSDLYLKVKDLNTAGTTRPTPSSGRTRNP